MGKPLTDNHNTEDTTHTCLASASIYLKRKLLFFAISMCCSFCSFGQAPESQGWLFITHQQKIGKSFKILADVQLRTANRYQYLNTMLLRTGLMYDLSEKHSIALGYAYKGDWEKEDYNDDKAYSFENRIFEQFIYNFKWHKTEMMFRGRLEQRWVKADAVQFSQRARAMLGAQIPLLANQNFSRGIYMGLQDELFLNVMNKSKVNGSVFDQNRVFLSFGYRWNKAIDTELGYQHWYQKEETGRYNRHVLQLQITTQF
ncbi:DUF2490 domain-containing protein [Pedobacter sp. BMA]|uniref:DUF2490 domain-containing protein n=1 Tax=Pedobacter sp. BMA TaxID=1663685 RepID=UPI000AF6A4E7|nr:DUF2490 domain-containing protein [Pedobacter sp. BMA]